MKRQRVKILLCAAVFGVGALYDLILQALTRRYTTDGVHFHPWSSEDMMQTVSLKDLRDDPWRTLLNIHIQPPGFDAIRAGFVQLWPSLSDTSALTRVDQSLYYLGAILLGGMCAIVFLWLLRQSNVAVALTGSAIMMLHPASVLFATFLDSTLLSALLVLWCYFLLWQIKNGRSRPIMTFSLLVLALFLTRSLFQWPALVLLGLSLVLLRVPPRGILLYAAIVGLPSGVFLAKQYYLFKIPLTSSFAGVNLSNSIGVGMGTAKYAGYLQDPTHPSLVKPGMPDVLIGTTKTGGQPNFNNIDYLFLNSTLLAKYQKSLRHMSAADLASAYWENTTIFFKPSSTYSSGNVIVERLPWTGLYNIVFSAPILPGLLLLGLGIWRSRVRRSGAYLSGAGILLPGLYILLVSIVSDRGENMRFKFFLEPVMLVFLFSQFYVLARGARQWLLAKHGTA